MACSVCQNRKISKTMAATKSSAVPTKVLGANKAAVVSNSSPRMVSHSMNVTPGVKPGVTRTLPKVGK